MVMPESGCAPVLLQENVDIYLQPLLSSGDICRSHAIGLAEMRSTIEERILT